MDSRPVIVPSSVTLPRSPHWGNENGVERQCSPHIRAAKGENIRLVPHHLGSSPVVEQSPRPLMLDRLRVPWYTQGNRQEQEKFIKSREQDK